jgi:hypothetical protein
MKIFLQHEYKNEDDKKFARENFYKNKLDGKPHDVNLHAFKKAHDKNFGMKMPARL